MFGKLRVSTCSLGPEAREAYRADFCSLCHSLREQEGRLATLLTNYDSTLWLTVASGLSEPGKTETRPCTALAWRKVQVRRHSSRVSAANVALLWLLLRAKAQDDLEDEGSWKARVMLRWTEGPSRLAEDQLGREGFEVKAVSDLPRRQREAEAAPQATLASVTEPTCLMMEAVFGHLAQVLEQPERRPFLAGFGRALGRGLYLLDALEDYQSDRAAGRFNPIHHLPGARTGLELRAAAESLALQIDEARQDLGLLEPSAGLVASAVDRLLGRIFAHGLLEQPAGACLCRPRRLGQAAFCHISEPDDERKNSCCNEGCGDSCECCCEAPDCCDCAGCDCGGCDCGGCDCGGCSCSFIPPWLRR